jgi:hypothetical protein
MRKHNRAVWYLSSICTWFIFSLFLFPIGVFESRPFGLHSLITYWVCMQAFAYMHICETNGWTVKVEREGCSDVRRGRRQSKKPFSFLMNIHSRSFSVLLSLYRIDYKHSNTWLLPWPVLNKDQDKYKILSSESDACAGLWVLAHTRPQYPLCYCISRLQISNMLQCTIRQPIYLSAYIIFISIFLWFTYLHILNTIVIINIVMLVTFLKKIKLKSRYIINYGNAVRSGATHAVTLWQLGRGGLKRIWGVVRLINEGVRCYRERGMVPTDLSSEKKNIYIYIYIYI